MCIVINDKSQGNIAKHLSWEVFIHYKFIIQFAGDKKIKIGATFGEFTGKMVDSFMRPIRLTLLSSKMLTRPISKTSSHVSRQTNVSLWSTNVKPSG